MTIGFRSHTSENRDSPLKRWNLVAGSGNGVAGGGGSHLPVWASPGLREFACQRSAPMTEKILPACALLTLCLFLSAACLVVGLGGFTA